MPAYLSNELAGTTTGLTLVATGASPGYKPRASVYHARLKRMRASITMASQLIGDTFAMGSLPPGAVFAFCVIGGSQALGSSTVSVGVAGNATKYTTTQGVSTFATPVLGGLAPQYGASDFGLTAEEPLILTIAGAALPSSGLLVVDVYYSMPT